MKAKMKFPNQARFMRRARKESRLSQKQLAKVCSVDGQYISNIERGISGIPISIAACLSKLGQKTQKILEVAVADFALNWKREYIGARKRKAKNIVGIKATKKSEQLEDKVYDPHDKKD